MMDFYPPGTNFYQLNNLMRTLWEQHATWTRSAIVSIVDNLNDIDQVTQRLLRNPADLAAAFQPFYGPEAADRLNKLISDHLVLAAQLVKAAKAGDTAAAAEIERKWYANADEIAAFFHCINPYWSQEAMTAMWHEHLAFVKSQAVSRLNKDYSAEIAFYDRGEKMLLEMADELTNGIVRQFPAFF